MAENDKPDMVAGHYVPLSNIEKASLNSGILKDQNTFTADHWQRPHQKFPLIKWVVTLCQLIEIGGHRNEPSDYGIMEARRVKEKRKVRSVRGQ